MASLDVFDRICIAVYDGSHCKEDCETRGSGRRMHISSPDMTLLVRLVTLQGGEVKVHRTGTGLVYLLEQVHTLVSGLLYFLHSSAKPRPRG